MESSTAFCIPGSSVYVGTQFKRRTFFPAFNGRRKGPSYAPLRRQRSIAVLETAGPTPEKLPDPLVSKPPIPELPASLPDSLPTIPPGSSTPRVNDSYKVIDWSFKSFRVQYAEAIANEVDTADKPAVVLVHGFGANCQHWRHNMGPLAQRGFRVYALDLLGFGMGDKPLPGTIDSDGGEVEYTFDYWTAELAHFIDTVVEPALEGKSKSPRPVFLVANSIGCMVTMQYAIEQPLRVAALTFISPSLRQLNVRKRSWVQDVTAPFLMRVMSYRRFGAFFLDSLAKPRALRRVLSNAYGVTSAVDDDLVRILREPAMTPGALDVFLSFISYDTGPIPEDFLPHLAQPTLVIWGEDDLFEPYELGQQLRHYSIVESFVSIPGAGHCAHDEMPDHCNQLIGDFLEKHSEKATVSSR